MARVANPQQDAGWLQTSLNVEVSVGDIVGCAPRLIAGGCAMGCGMGCLGLRDGLFGKSERRLWQCVEGQVVAMGGRSWPR